ncbi:Vacuolar protein sorting-associated protein family member protein [Theileria equi strain WA]|uniref:Vacuolar protein sorting-associated protein family member protein n=1 Tax=Theileria equi strain WA TaxID=1537102 RepID=L1LEU5_THEEQ|nr:Vacuolar protein sorting-associated protein family member protein [Theileria equi strain WA]EKX73866.1 Vacuolar protein sorting-associated protein family member protein [Theileria equi strain WA]|eukprot:XP_004833318.1 Vacuolar protein sorting-associated protein family member protein [Theileria equi strain WA]
MLSDGTFGGINAFQAMDQGKMLEEAIFFVKEQSYYMKKAIVNRKCGDNTGAGCTCPGKKPDGGIEVSKGTDKNAVGFVAFTHYLKSGTFTLLQDLGNTERLEDNEVTEVKKVSVYYWDGDTDYEKPLLLEVVKYDEQKVYYKRSEDGEKGESETHIWKQYIASSGTALQAMLDDRNCARNNVVPLILEDPEKGIDTSSNCAKEKGIQFFKPYPLTGSDYMATEYKITGLDAKISRIEYQKTKINGIDIPNVPVSQIRLFSSPVNGNLPLMINFNPKSGEPRWYYSKDGNGNDWGETGNDNRFYGSKPTEHLSKKLDELACQYHNGVTIDLSYGTSTSVESYCCEEHANKKKGKNDGKITITTENIKLDGGAGTLPYYKHSVQAGQSVADIKFYHDGDQEQRRHVKSNKLTFPMDGPADIYTFYSSNSKDPKLIYFYKNGDPKATGWYRMQSNNGHNKRWRKTSGTLGTIKKNHIESRTLGCQQWNSLIGELKKRGTTDLPGCIEPTKQVERDGAGGGQEPGSEEVEEVEGDGENEVSNDEIETSLQGPLGPFPGPTVVKAENEDTKDDEIPKTNSKTGAKTSLSPGVYTAIPSPHDSGKGAVEGLLKTLVKLGLTGLDVAGLYAAIIAVELAKDVKDTAPKLVHLLSQDRETGGSKEIEAGPQGLSDPPDEKGKDMLEEHKTAKPDPSCSDIDANQTNGGVAETKVEGGHKDGEQSRVKEPQENSDNSTLTQKSDVTSSESHQPRSGSGGPDSGDDTSLSASQTNPPNVSPSPVTPPQPNDKSLKATNACGVSNHGALVVDTGGNGCIGLLSLGEGANILPDDKVEPAPLPSSPPGHGQGGGPLSGGEGGAAQEPQKTVSEPLKTQPQGVINPSPNPTTSTSPGVTSQTTTEVKTVTLPTEATPAELPKAEESAQESQAEKSIAGAIPAATATSLWTAFGSTSGPIAGAGSLTGLGWWAFKRSKGDPWEKEDVGNSLKHGSNIISELRTSTLSPTHYYELYMKVFNELEYLADFIGEHVKRKNVISELYESVQQATYILPRLYLLVMIGAHYIKSKKVPAKDILTDITELCKGVQHPMRGLFLRYYLVQICKDKLPDSEPDNENGFLDSFDFLMNNFCQSIRLWVRLTAGGYEQKRLEKERIELGLLVGANLVRITQLDGVDINFYSKVALPRILEEIGLIKDSVAKKYLLDCLIQAFSDEFHIHTIDAILTACVASIQSDDGITILITMMNRLSDFIVANPEALPQGVDMFQTFYKHLSTIVIKGSPNDQSQDSPRVGIRGYLDLHAAFLDFTTKLYPGVIEHVEFIENNIMEVLSGILPPDTVIEGQAAHSILKLITIPLKTLSLKTLELEYNSKLIKLLDTPVKKKLAYTIIDELIEAKISMDNISSFDVFFDFIAPLFTPSEDEFSEVISEETSERIHLEQDQICKLIQTIKCSNIQDQFGIYKNLFEKIRESGSRRMKHSLPCLLSCSLKLLFPSHGKSSKGLDWPLNQIQFAFDIFNLAGLISDLIQPIIPEETIKLLVLCAITANEFGSMYCRTYGNESNFSADLKRLCGSFILKACTCYEDELSTGRDQLASLKYMTAAISSKIYIIEREDYYNVAMILARYGSNMVRLLHRCEALVAAAYLFQNAQYFNETRIIWCLEKCISIINTYDFVKPFTRVKAFLIPLEAAKFFKIGDVTNNIRVHIDKLLPELSTDELEVYNKAIERIDRN